jgi:ATP-binding protein involved in chromosome partitioning
MMTIAVPMIGERFSEHFGGAQSFALYDVDEEGRTFDGRRVVATPVHERGVFPAWLREIGATVVLASGMGPRASGMLAQYGIEVVLGVQGDDPDQVVRDFLAGTLQATGEPCHDQSFHDCSHHERRGGGGCGGHHN